MFLVLINYSACVLYSFVTSLFSACFYIFLKHKKFLKASMKVQWTQTLFGFNRQYVLISQVMWAMALLENFCSKYVYKIHVRWVHCWKYMWMWYVDICNQVAHLPIQCGLQQFITRLMMTYIVTLLKWSPMFWVVYMTRYVRLGS